MAPIRAFVALDLPTAAAEEMVAWQREALAGRDDLRAIRPEALHVTLAFLGDIDEAGVKRASAVLKAEGASPPAVAMRVGPEPVGVPERRPRVIAFDAESEGALELRGRLAAGLVEAGLLEPGGRPFWPHLSVARVRGDPRRRGGRRAVLRGLPPLSGGEGHTFGAVRVALYRSELRSQGARYSVLAAFDLPRSGG